MPASNNSHGLLASQLCHPTCPPTPGLCPDAAVDGPWIVTRAQPDADADVAALRAAGITARAIPCIERVALPWPDVEFGMVMITSPFGAEQLLNAWPHFELKPLVAAMAPAT